MEKDPPGNKISLTRREKVKSQGGQLGKNRGGIGTKEAVYQTLDNARALRTIALPEYEREQEPQESRQRFTALTGGVQLAEDVSP